MVTMHDVLISSHETASTGVVGEVPRDRSP